MSIVDQKCMRCGCGYEVSGFYFQCRLRLCSSCHDALGGSPGVIAISREIEAEVDAARGAAIRARLPLAVPERKP